MQRIGRVDRRTNPEVERRLIADHPEVADSRGKVSFWNFLPPDELNALLSLYTKVTQKTPPISRTLGIEGRFDVEIDCLKRRFAGGSVLATACSGAILLAEAGLLDGEEATTHWAYCDVVAKRYPKVTMRPKRALVVTGDGGRLVMAGGGTSWLDLALYLIARCTDVETAMQCARINLIDWHDIGQQPFARLARTRQVDDAIVARCQTWIAEHYAEPAPVASMVRLSGLAERSFTRRFEQATGMAPLEYVHTLRLEEAKQMLEATDQPIEAIADEVGYEDAGFFSRLFKRNVNLTPAQYRKRFGAMRRALESGAASPRG